MKVDYNSLFDILAYHCGRENNKDSVLRWNDHVLTWGQVEHAARKVAGGLIEAGVTPGDRVAIMLPNIPPYLFLEFGALLAGAIIVPVHVYIRGEELGYLLDDSETKALFSWVGYHEIANNAMHQTESLRLRVEIGAEGEEIINFNQWLMNSPEYKGDPLSQGEDLAYIRYTAGVTGRPKGAMISHNNVIRTAIETQRVLRLKASDRIFGAMPLFHPFGGTLQVITTYMACASLELQTRFDPQEVYEKIESNLIDVLIGLPSHLTSLIDMGGDEPGVGQLRFAVSGGGPLDLSAQARFETHFATKVVNVYGTCETSPTLCINPAHIMDTPREALGRPISNVDIKIIGSDGHEMPVGKVGEIVARGPGVFKGYWNRPNATDNTVNEEGWFYTSDLGYVDINGWLYGRARMHDRINKGGFSVYPREVEGVINAHPAVYASAVIGEEDPQFGEEIIAYIVLRKGMPFSENDLVSYCEERLARYKVPRKITVLDRLPRSPNGAILRRALREGWSPS